MQAGLEKGFLTRFIDDEDEDLVESFKDNDFVLTGQVAVIYWRIG